MLAGKEEGGREGGIVPQIHASLSRCGSLLVVGLGCVCVLDLLSQLVGCL